MSARHLVFVPGLLCTRDLWTHQFDYLADLATCMVADVSTADSVDGLAEAVLAQAPPTFALCGLSLGGIVAQAVMRLAPQRVERLALLGTSARADTAEQSARRRQLMDMVTGGRFADVFGLIWPSLVHPLRLRERALAAAVRRMVQDVGPDACLRQVQALMNRPDSRADLGAYALPTLVLCGREDGLTPLALHEELGAAIPGAHLAVIEECGHLSSMERPHAVTALLRQWLLY